MTGLAFLERGGRLVTCSKDSFVKVWDLATQHCSQTVVGHRCTPQAPAHRPCITLVPTWPGKIHILLVTMLDCPPIAPVP